MGQKDYDVGYKKPPKSGQFKPGQSGNQKGRPKGAKNLKTVFEKELLAKVPIKEEGKSKKVSKQEAMIKALMLKAMQGDIKAINTVLTAFTKLLGGEGQAEEETELSNSENVILERFKDMVLKEAGAEKTEEKDG